MDVLAGRPALRAAGRGGVLFPGRQTRRGPLAQRRRKGAAGRGSGIARRAEKARLRTGAARPGHLRHGPHLLLPDLRHLRRQLLAAHAAQDRRRQGHDGDRPVLDHSLHRRRHLHAVVRAQFGPDAGTALAHPCAGAAGGCFPVRGHRGSDAIRAIPDGHYAGHRVHVGRIHGILGHSIAVPERGSGGRRHRPHQQHRPSGRLSQPVHHRLVQGSHGVAG
ncbi:hypothetical protein D3C71_1576010 [compost metagenome]